MTRWVCATAFCRKLEGWYNWGFHFQRLVAWLVGWLVFFSDHWKGILIALYTVFCKGDLCGTSLWIPVGPPSTPQRSDDLRIEDVGLDIYKNLCNFGIITNLGKPWNEGNFHYQTPFWWKSLVRDVVIMHSINLHRDEAEIQRFLREKTWKTTNADPASWTRKLHLPQCNKCSWKMLLTNFW